MIRIVLVLVLLVLVYWFIHSVQKMPVAVIKAKLGKAGWVLAGLIVLWLVGSGKLNWLFAMLGVAIAFVMRLMPVFLHYAPQFQRLWQLFKSGAEQSEARTSGNSARSMGGLSKEEALEILGLKAGATDEEIIQAHRKLIARLHPDKGGSSYLSARINLAKRVLLQG